MSGFTSWIPDVDSKVAWKMSLVARIQRLMHWTWYHGCLVKAPGCLDLVPGALELVPFLPGEGSVPVSLDFVPWLNGDGSWLPKFTSWLPGLTSGSLGLVPSLLGLCSMVVSRRLLVAGIHFLVPWT